jgi:hypothetical protein
VAELSEAQQRQREEAARSHGVYSYRDRNQLPARLDEGFDVKLAEELLKHVGGNQAYRLLAQSAARRATLLAIAYSWLADPDVPVLWAEERDGHKIVKMQPILRAIGSWHEGLRRDLSELGLTPTSAARLGLGSKETLDALLSQRVREDE